MAMEFSDRAGDRPDDALLAERDTEWMNSEDVRDEPDGVEVWREDLVGGGTMPFAIRNPRGR